MTPRPIAYVAHPIAGCVPANVASALEWLGWLMRSEPGVAFVAPYLTAIAAGAKDHDPVQRARGMLDNLAVIDCCKAIVLVGGRISPGMGVERDRAVELELRVFDLTGLGVAPPPETMAGMLELLGEVAR